MSSFLPKDFMGNMTQQYLCQSNSSLHETRQLWETTDEMPPNFWDFKAERLFSCHLNIPIERPITNTLFQLHMTCQWLIPAPVPLFRGRRGPSCAQNIKCDACPGLTSPPPSPSFAFSPFLSFLSFTGASSLSIPFLLSYHTLATPLPKVTFLVFMSLMSRSPCLVPYTTWFLRHAPFTTFCLPCSLCLVLSFTLLITCSLYHLSYATLALPHSL